MNSSNFSGRLIKDIEIRTLKGKTSDYSAGKFTIACPTRRKKEGDKYYEDQLVQVTVIGSQADFIAKYFKKGDVIEITNAEYVSRTVEKDGTTRYFHEFQINNNSGVNFPPRALNKDRDDSQSNQGWSNNSNTSNNSNASTSSTQDSDPFSGGSSIDLSDDDLPF